MTRKSIFSLVTLLVALFVASQASVVTAHDVCGDPPGQWCAAMATPDGTGPLVVGNAAGNPAESTQGLADSGTVWVTLGTMTYDEVKVGASAQPREISCPFVPAPCEMP